MNYSFFPFRLATFIVVGILLLSSCSIEEPDISNLRDFKLNKFEGSHIEAEFTVDCTNPNGFGFKMKKALIDVSVDDQVLGKISLDKKLKVKRKSTNSYTVPLTIELEKGALIQLMKLSLRKEITLQFKGKVRGSVMGISKSFKVDETKTVDGGLLNLSGN